MSAEIFPGTDALPAPGHSARSHERVVRAGNPASLLALIPHLLGFTPDHCIVVLGAEPPRGRVRLTMRFDLPGAPDAETAASIADRALGILADQGLTAGAVAGYGPGAAVTPLADALRSQAANAGIHLAEVLRAEGGRYWSYLCTDPNCCSPDGEPYDVASHPVTAAFAEAGAPPVLASREELSAIVSMLGGEAGEAMSHAITRAQQRSARLAAMATDSGDTAGRRLIATAGLDAVRQALDACRDGGELLSDDDAAWLLLVLGDLRVRDDAWSRMDPGHRDAHLLLWADLTRRARPGYVAPVASLLAFVAWQGGNGALANVALDRAQADNPGYTMAQLLREVIDSGAPPSMSRPPMTPEEVAASYGEEEAAAACGTCADGASLTGYDCHDPEEDCSIADSPGSPPAA